MGHLHVVHPVAQQVLELFGQLLRRLVELAVGQVVFLGVGEDQPHVPGEVELVVVGPVLEARVDLPKPHGRGNGAVVVGRARHVQGMWFQEIDHERGDAEPVEHGAAAAQLAAQTPKHLRRAGQHQLPGAAGTLVAVGHDRTPLHRHAKQWPRHGRRGGGGGCIRGCCFQKDGVGELDVDKGRTGGGSVEETSSVVTMRFAPRIITSR